MSKTTPPEGNYQERVASFVAGHDLETDIAARVLDLLSELADVFFSLICLANSTGVDLNRGLEKVMAKYSQRLQDKGDPGSS